MNFNEQVYELVGQIPAGRVLSYGRIARLLGVPQGARAVGWALAACDPSVPWHRVVNSEGGISNIAHAEEQRRRLVAEGVVFTTQDRVDLTRCLWRPNEWEQLSLLDATES